MNVARHFYRTAHPMEHTPLENRLTSAHFIHLRKDVTTFVDFPPFDTANIHR